MKITENDIQANLSSMDGSLSIKVKNKWIKLNHDSKINDLILALRYNWGILLTLSDDNNIIRLELNKYKNVDGRILDSLYGIRKDYGVVDEET